MTAACNENIRGSQRPASLWSLNVHEAGGRWPRFYFFGGMKRRKASVADVLDAVVVGWLSDEPELRAPKVEPIKVQYLKPP